MNRLVVLKLDGNLEQQGFRVTLEISFEGKQPEIEVRGQLPPFPELATALTNWQETYHRIAAPARLKPGKIIYDGSVNNAIVECSDSAHVLGDRLTTWLNADGFRPIDKRLREELARDENIRVLIRTENNHLQKLPWHLWDFIERYPKAEVALSYTNFAKTKKFISAHPKTKIRILAILGHSAGINIAEDRRLLESLPGAETVFLVEPKRQEINNQLWEQPWDIIFFAGHSETEGETGKIYINPQESLEINDLWFGLRKAVENGLKLAIFNSCDGLGLSWQLDDTQIPQMIVMRDLVPDRVAHSFLKYFLSSFASGKSFYVAVREARERLQGLEGDLPCATWLPTICQNPAELPVTWADLLNQHPKVSWQGWRQVLLASLAVTSLVMGVRYGGWLQPVELQSYDQLMRSRPQEFPDNRLLIVTITEPDLQLPEQQDRKGSLSDKALNLVLNKLASYQPRAIGLSLLRDFPVNPQEKQLATRLQQNPQIIGTCFVSNVKNSDASVAPPPEIPPKQIGFSNILADNFLDGTFRRSILFLDPYPQSRCPSSQAFALKLALLYLEKEGVKPEETKEGHLKLGEVIFNPWENHTGGYQNIDSSGHQILINYRSPNSPLNLADTITLKQILNNEINANIVKDRIILIGVTAPSVATAFRTPYGSGFQQEIPGVIFQAQVVSHILSAVLNGRPIIWAWPLWGDILWVWSWSVVGAVIAWRVRSLLYLVLIGGVATSSLYGICWALFLHGAWVPLIPSAIALVLGSSAIATYHSQQQTQLKTSPFPLLAK